MIYFSLHSFAISDNLNLKQNYSSHCFSLKENKTIKRLDRSESESSSILDIPISEGLRGQIPQMKTPFQKRWLEDIHKIQEVVHQSSDFNNDPVDKENFDLGK